MHILYKKCCKKSFHKYFCRIILQIIVKHKEKTTPSFDYFSAIGPSSHKKLQYCLTFQKSYYHWKWWPSNIYRKQSIFVREITLELLQIALQFSTSITCSKIHISFIENNNFWNVKVLEKSSICNSRRYVWKQRFFIFFFNAISCFHWLFVCHLKWPPR